MLRWLLRAGTHVHKPPLHTRVRAYTIHTSRDHLDGHSHDRPASDRAESMGEGKGVMSSSRGREAADEPDDVAGDALPIAAATEACRSESWVIVGGVDNGPNTTGGSWAKVEKRR